MLGKLFKRRRREKRYHAHEHTQPHLVGDSVKLDPDFINVLKNIRDQIGSLNANLENFDDSSSKLANALNIMVLLI